MRLNPLTVMRQLLDGRWPQYEVAVELAPLQEGNFIVLKGSPIVGRLGRTQRLGVWQPRVDVLIYPSQTDVAYEIVDLLQQTPLDVKLDERGTRATIFNTEVALAPTAVWDGQARLHYSLMSFEITVDRQVPD